MSDESLLLIESLKERIHRLLGEFEKVEQRNAGLIKELAVLQSRIGLLEEQLAHVNKKYENLKLAKGFESGGDNRAVRQKINKLVREIDKCVALLNE